MRVEFSRRRDGGSLAAIERDDGVRLLLRSYDRTGEVPHDAVHLVAEQELGLTQGLWGSLAAGAVFDSVEVVGAAVARLRTLRSQWRDLGADATVAFTWPSGGAGRRTS